MRLVAVAAAAVVGVAVLAGCSAGEQANETLPSTSLSGSAEPSATLQPLGPPDLPMPDEAREMTAAGAEAFLRYYFAVYNLAQDTMDAQYFRDLARGCETCDRLAEELETDAARGYAYEGGAITVNGVSPPLLQGTGAELTFSIVQSALTIVDTNGQAIEELSFPEISKPAGGVLLTWTGAYWVITQWDIN